MMDAENNSCLKQEVRRVPAETGVENLRIVMPKVGDLLDCFNCSEMTHALSFFFVRRQITRALTCPPQHHS